MYKKNNEVIDFTLEKYQPKHKKVFKLLIILTIVVSAIYSGGNYYIQLNEQYKINQQKIKEIKNEIAVLDSIKSRDIALGKIEDEIRRKDKVIKSIEDRKLLISNYIKILESNTPLSIKFLNITFNDEREVLIQGKTKDKKDIAVIIKQLNEKLENVDVFVPKITTSQEYYMDKQNEDNTISEDMYYQIFEFSIIIKKAGENYDK